MKAKVELLNNGGVIGSEPDPVTIDLANITRTVAIFDSAGPAQSLGGPSHVVIDGVRVTQIGGTFHKDLPVKSAGHDYAQVPTGAPVIVVLRGASTPASVGGFCRKSGGHPVPAQPLSLIDLAKSPIITFPKDTVAFREVKRLFANPNLPVPLIHGCASLATILHLVRDGFGIGLLPVPMAANDIRVGRLSPVQTTSEAQISDLEFAFCYGATQEHTTMEQVRQAALAAVKAYLEASTCTA